MVMTVLEAEVQPDKQGILAEAFRRAVKELEPGIVETFLLSDASNGTTWRIATVWESRAALDAMRASGQTPRGVLMFREAGAVPRLSILDVAVHGSA